MTQKLNENGKDDTGYYTPKNILNPAMFRLAEITRALSEVNMEIEQEKLFEDRRHTINIEQFGREEEEAQRIEVFQEERRIDEHRPRREGLRKTLENHEDEIGRVLVICLGLSIALLVVLLVFWA